MVPRINSINNAQIIVFPDQPQIYGCTNPAICIDNKRCYFLFQQNTEWIARPLIQTSSIHCTSHNTFQSICEAYNSNSTIPSRKILLQLQRDVQSGCALLSRYDHNINQLVLTTIQKQLQNGPWTIS